MKDRAALSGFTTGIGINKKTKLRLGLRPEILLFFFIPDIFIVAALLCAADNHVERVWQ